MPTTSLVTMDRKQSREEAQAAPTGAAPIPKQAKPLDAPHVPLWVQIRISAMFQVSTKKSFDENLNKARSTIYLSWKM